jgi:phosphatidylglycerophosphatase A
VRKFLLSGFWTGFLPIAPGTWGSFLAAVLWLGGATGLNAAGYDVWSVLMATIVAILVASAICVGFGNYAITVWKRNDPSHVVIDEFAGQWLSLLPVIFVSSRLMLFYGVMIAFFMFRVFDVIKPPPVRQVEALPAGTGILVDDLLAGVYAAAATWFLLWAMQAF